MQNICFFIAPLRDADSLTRQRSEDVFESVITPAALQNGLFPKFCSSEQPGTITTNIYDQLLRARVIVADLTTGNCSVGYELAFAHSRQKPTIIVIQEGFTIPYDLRDMHVVRYDYSERRRLKGALPVLAAQVKGQLRSSANSDNPILNACRVIERKVDPPTVAMATVLPPVLSRLVLPPPPSLPSPSDLESPTRLASPSDLIRPLMPPSKYPVLPAPPSFTVTKRPRISNTLSVTKRPYPPSRIPIKVSGVTDTIVATATAKEVVVQIASATRRRATGPLYRPRTDGCRSSVLCGRAFSNPEMSLNRSFDSNAE